MNAGVASAQASLGDPNVLLTPDWMWTQHFDQRSSPEPPEAGSRSLQSDTPELLILHFLLLTHRATCLTLFVLACFV